MCLYYKNNLLDPSELRLLYAAKMLRDTDKLSDHGKKGQIHTHVCTTPAWTMDTSHGLTVNSLSPGRLWQHYATAFTATELVNGG